MSNLDIENKLQKMVSLNKNQTIYELLQNSADDFVMELKKIMAHYLTYDFLFNANHEIVDKYTPIYESMEDQLTFSSKYDDLPDFDFVFNAGMQTYDFDNAIDKMEKEIKEYHTCSATGELICKCNCELHYFNDCEVI